MTASGIRCMGRPFVQFDDSRLPSPRSRCIYRVTLGLVALNLLWRTMRYALNFPLWGDEAFLATSFYSRGFGDMVRPLEYGQIVPLGFMWAEWAFTRIFGLSERALRLLPFLLGLATMLLFWRVVARRLGRRTAMLAAAIFAASYFPMRYGAELKPYGLDLFMSLLLTSLGWRVLRRPDDVARWGVLILGSAIAIWCSYPSVFIAGAVGLALTYRLSRGPTPRFTLAWFLYGLVLLASFLAVFFCIARPQFRAASWLAEMGMWTSAFPPLDKPWRLPLWLLDVHTGELLAYPVGGKHGGSAVPFLLVVIGSIALWRRHRDSLVLLLGPLPLTFIAAALHRYPYGGGPRVSLYMAPAFCILEAIGLAALLRRFVPRRRIPGALTAVVGSLPCLIVAGLLRDVIKPYKNAADRDNRQVIRDLAASASPGDRWLIFNSLDDPPYAPNLARWGGSGARFRYYVTTLAPVGVQWSPPPGEVTQEPSRLTWLLVYRDNKEPFPEEQFSQYLQSVTDLLGPARRSLHKLGDVEAIEIYEFGSRRRRSDDRSDPTASAPQGDRSPRPGSGCMSSALPPEASRCWLRCEGRQNRPGVDGPVLRRTACRSVRS
jgi:hypothetical protein